MKNIFTKICRKGIKPYSQVVVFTLMSCLLLTGCSKSTTAVEEIPLVRSQTVAMDAIGNSASYAGEVRGRFESQLAFQVNGKIIKRNVELGSVVQPGDVLMEIDAKDLQQGVNGRSAQVAAAESQLSLAETNLKRYRELYSQNVISQADLDRYQSAYDNALAMVQQASAQYEQGANQLDYSVLRADSAGVISSIDAEMGQVVGAGQKVLTLVQNGETEVEISVPENRIDELRKAGQIKVKFWALQDIVVDGKVREVSPMADKVTRTYKVRISLINPPQELKLGMTATVMVANAGSQATTFVPLSAIYQTGDSPAVWVVNDGVVNLRNVKTGNFGDGKIQIIEGLNYGDIVVTAGVHKLREGQKVRLAGETK